MSAWGRADSCALSLIAQRRLRQRPVPGQVYPTRRIGSRPSRKRPIRLLWVWFMPSTLLVPEGSACQRASPRAQRAGDVTTAAVLPGWRAEHARRLAEPDVEFRPFCARGIAWLPQPCNWSVPGTLASYFRILLANVYHSLAIRTHHQRSGVAPYVRKAPS